MKEDETMNLLLNEILSFPRNNFISGNWYSLTFIDALNQEKRIVGIRKFEVDKNMNEKKLIECLLKYFAQIEQDNLKIANNICSKGCNYCCTSDFEVSITEYFAILRYIGVNFGAEAVKDISEQAKLSLNLPGCIFVDNTNGSCKIYEVRPLVCRKYGLYACDTDCAKLNGTELLQPSLFTGKNTYFFESSKNPSQKILSKPKRLVHWFANMEDGKLKSQRMKDLFYACFNQSVDEFVEILLK